MVRDPVPPTDPRVTAYRLRIWRVASDTTCTVRTLSPAIQGLFAHWRNGRSFYCNPGGCPSDLHSKPQNWKGYIAAERWVEQLQLWFPVCLELTEHCELDMRGAYERGQVWELSREKESKTVKRPVVARLHEVCDERSFPIPFDILPVLRTLYHADHIALDVANPMPPRTLVQPSKGAAPRKAETAAPERRATPEEIAELRRRASERMKLPLANGAPK